MLISIKRAKPRNSDLQSVIRRETIKKKMFGFVYYFVIDCSLPKKKKHLAKLKPSKVIIG